VSSAIPGMSIKVMRSALAKIRVSPWKLSDIIVSCNTKDYNTEDVCVSYLYGQHLKRRKSKQVRIG